MNRKILIVVLILFISIIGSSLFFHMKGQQANKIELDDESKTIYYKGNVKTTIRPATKEEIIEDFMKTELLNYEEAEKLYNMEQRKNQTEDYEEIRTVILQSTHYYDSVGIRFNAIIKYTYNLVENKPVSIDYIGNIWTDTVGEVKLLEFRSTEPPRINSNDYRLEISLLGNPIIEVNNSIADTLIDKYNFNEIGKNNIFKKILEPEDAMYLEIEVTLEDLI